MSLTNEENWPFGRLVKACIQLKLKPHNCKEEILKFKSCLQWMANIIESVFEKEFWAHHSVFAWGQSIYWQHVSWACWGWESCNGPALTAANDDELFIQITNIFVSVLPHDHLSTQYEIIMNPTPSGSWMMKDKGKSYICLCGLKDISGNGYTRILFWLSSCLFVQTNQ